jgi:phospholipase/carboxylesterase
MENLVNKLPLHSAFIPSVDKGMTSGQKYMIMLHGRGDSMESYKYFAKEINVTGLNYILLNAPAKIEFGYSWYHDSFDLNDELYCHSIELLKKTIQLIKESSVDPEDLFILGFSQGARMALDIFYELGIKLAGVCALSPRMSTYHDFSALSEDCLKTPLFTAHGQYDPVIPFRETQEALSRWQTAFSDAQFTSYEMGHEIDISEIQALREWINQKL